MVIQESIRKRLEQLEVYLMRLEEMKGIAEEEFLKDWKAQDIIIRNFQLAIESCADIGAKIISLNNFRVPESYAGVVDVLAEKNILPRDFAAGFKELVKFRNIIVHAYLKIDYKVVYKNLGRRNEIRRFAKYIVEYLNS